jgi:hypothetical protein
VDQAADAPEPDMDLPIGQTDAGERRTWRTSFSQIPADISVKGFLISDNDRILTARRWTGNEKGAIGTAAVAD